MKIEVNKDEFIMLNQLIGAGINAISRRLVEDGKDWPEQVKQENREIMDFGDKVLTEVGRKEVTP